MRKLLGKIVMAVLSLCMLMPIAACGGTNGDLISVDFWYSVSFTENSVMKKLISTYNEKQGIADGVVVKGDNRKNIDKSSLYVDAPNILSVSDEDFKSFAVENLYLNLNSYFKDDAGGYTENDIPESLTQRYRFDSKDNSEGKRNAGEGADLMGLPFGSNGGQVYFYSIPAFEAAGINIISKTEDLLTGDYAAVLPHGYAEYKQAPVAGMKASKNLAGETVYKVFNNQIPMNWEEHRYLTKSMTKDYNPEWTATTYGSATHWWFSYGWSVGGDCIGYDGSKYIFTVADKSANYLVTAKNGVTVNANKYASGEIVSYEDKVKTPNISSVEGLYELPSQYDALLEFNRLTVPSSKEVDGGINGYGISTTASDNQGSVITKGTVAYFASSLDSLSALNVSYKGNYNVAPSLQYRKYKGGSVYQKDGKTGFVNEYLKVIGETYNGEVYTGEIAYENGTPLFGKQGGFNGSNGLVIPSRSDSSKYGAAWKFIRWAASEAGQSILMEMGVTPNQMRLSFGDYIDGDTSINRWAFSNAVRYGDIGDWAYFENGKWVSDWSGLFNNQLRAGYMTISDFNTRFEKSANESLSAVSIILRGRR